ncbi:sulfur carrier protein ThiS [Saccharopolyspora sp. MS10]|uniref:sulfur carrier protein ThiS n=1 Tax=Saccharopolyspora sp. MS10 TaxID=3385973 RepID=UPI0039A3C058
MQVLINGAPRPVTADDTLAGVLAEFGVAERGVAVAVDGAVVPRASWPATRLRDGAVVEVLTAVQGG